MTLSSMVLSRDWQEVSVLECVLGGLQIDVAVEKEPQRALERLGKSKIDAVIVDCDLNGSSQFLRELQLSHKRELSVPLVIMGCAQSRPSLDATGALFAFEKPISVEEAVRTLSAARSMMLDGRLRYRAGLELPVSVKCRGRKTIDGYLLNISQGGMLIHTEANVDASAELHVAFTLPNNATELRTQARLAWQDKAGNLAIRFVKMASRQQRTLELWLAEQFLEN
jgi:PilZ domain